MNSFPTCIEKANISTTDLNYVFENERSIRSYYEDIDVDMFERLNLLTNKANTGLTIAIGQWIYARYTAVNDDPLPLRYIKAAWAGSIHPAYCEYYETDDNKWLGNVRSILATTITLINDALFCLSINPDVGVHVCWIYNLARYVLPDTRAFDEWFEFCVQRMEKYHTKDLELDGVEQDLFDDFPPQGSPIPFQAFDPDFDYNPDQNPQLLDVYLQSVDPEKNPGKNEFLLPHIELQDLEDLPGEPYRYSVF